MESPEEAIRRRAHEIWEMEGRPEGYASLHWERAKQELGGGGGIPSKARRAGKTVAELMTPAITAAPEDRLDTLMQRMMAADIGFLPICEGGRIVGVVTDRDILMRCVARHCDPRATRAADIMTAEVRCCAADNSTEDALAAMRENHVRRLPVLDTERRLVGVVSYSDLTGERSAHAPYHVVFHKTLIDDYGRSRQVEIERVRVGPGHTKAEAVAAAIREVERARRRSWRDIADGYSVIDLQAPAAPAGTERGRSRGQTDEGQTGQTPPG